MVIHMPSTSADSCAVKLISKVAVKLKIRKIYSGYAFRQGYRKAI